jgi:class 3 adenylate cyclase
MGLEMHEALSELNNQYHWNFRIRVGITTGRLVTGVIGKYNFEYVLRF